MIGKTPGKVGQDLLAGSQFLAQSLGEAKSNALKGRVILLHSIPYFPADTLLVLPGDIWESQVLAHVAVVYEISAAIRFHISLFLKTDRSIMKTTRFMHRLPSLTAIPLLYSPLYLHLAVKGPSTGNAENLKPEFSTSLRLTFSAQFQTCRFQRTLNRHPEEMSPLTAPLKPLFSLLLRLH